MDIIATHRQKYLDAVKVHNECKISPNVWGGWRITNNALSFGIDIVKTKNQIVMFGLSGFLIGYTTFSNFRPLLDK